MNELADRGKRGLDVTDAKFEGNTSGWDAVDYKILIKKDKVEETTDAGIVIPTDLVAQESWNIDTGVLVSHGDLAFTQGRKPNGEFYHWNRKPEVGDRVMVKSYTGQYFKGDDGEQYHIFTDKDIIGVKV